MVNDRIDREEPRFELTEVELSNVSAGKSDSFLTLGDIKGESTDKGHKDWIEILSY